MAERKVTETMRDRRGRILALCNPREPWSPRRTQDALRDIHYDLHRYVAVGGGKEAEVRGVGGRSGLYLRSEWDQTTADNLDELPLASKGNSLTGVSDIAVQLREDVVESLTRAMHRAGVTEHRAIWVKGDRQVELSLGAPENVTLIPTEDDDEEARARLQLPVLYRARPLEAADDPGEAASARVNVRARVASMAAPTGAQLVIDWSETRDEDVEVMGPDDEEVSSDIGQWAREQGARGHDVRLPGLTDRGGLSELTIAFRRGGRGNLVAVTLSLGGAPPEGAGRVAGDAFLERDWALALSEHLVTERIRDGLRQALGALPPPFGPDPVVLPGTTDLFLDSFDVLLADGAIVFEGLLRREGTPVITATYRAEVELELSNGRVRAEVGEVKVETREWYASLADFVSGGAITGAVERGLRQSLGAGASGRITTLFSGELLRGVASVGADRAIDAEPVIEEIELRDAGVVAHGRLEVEDLDPPPIAAFTVQPSRGGPRRRILHAGGSWAPGGRLTEFKWSLGDGEEEEVSGVRTRFVVEHEYSPGRFTPRLTVKNDRGATATATRPMEVE